MIFDSTESVNQDKNSDGKCDCNIHIIKTIICDAFLSAE